MTDSPHDPGTDVRPDHASTTGTPRWVKVFGAIVGIVILLFVILLLTKGPGGHGPSRHMPAGDLGGIPVSPASAASEGVGG